VGAADLDDIVPRCRLSGDRIAQFRYRRDQPVIDGDGSSIADGKLSFDDCDMFTWSFGGTGDLLPVARRQTDSSVRRPR
jgi:hypothetical protein